MSRSSRTTVLSPDALAAKRRQWQDAFKNGVRVTKHTDHGDEVYRVTKTADHEYRWERIAANGALEPGEASAT